MFAFFYVFCQSQCKCGSLEPDLSKIYTTLIIGSDKRPPRNNWQGHSSSVLNTVANHPFPHKRQSDTVVPSTKKLHGIEGFVSSLEHIHIKTVIEVFLRRSSSGIWGSWFCLKSLLFHFFDPVKPYGWWMSCSSSSHSRYVCWSEGRTVQHKSWIRAALKLSEFNELRFSELWASLKHLPFYCKVWAKEWQEVHMRVILSAQNQKRWVERKEEN